MSDACREHPAEGEIAFLPGSEPNTGLRVRTMPDHSVLLEQVAFDPVLGWYRQKSITLPRDMVTDVAQALKLADCLLPRPVAEPAVYRFPGPAAQKKLPQRAASGQSSDSQPASA